MEFGFDEDNTVEEFLDDCVLALVIRIGDRLQFDIRFFIDCRLGVRCCASPLLSDNKHNRGYSGQLRGALKIRKL
jgi:hypothetical protein